MKMTIDMSESALAIYMIAHATIIVAFVTCIVIAMHNALRHRERD